MSYILICKIPPPPGMSFTSGLLEGLAIQAVGMKVKAGTLIAGEVLEGNVISENDLQILKLKADLHGFESLPEGMIDQLTLTYFLNIKNTKGNIITEGDMLSINILPMIKPVTWLRADEGRLQ